MARYTAKDIKNWHTDVQAPDYRWFPARPCNHEVESIKSRVKNTWGVLTGKYDALDWEDEFVNKVKS